MANLNEAGRLVVITGPPGCGKTTLIRAYATKYGSEGVHQVQSNTTRPRRGKEVGYNFQTLKDFEEMDSDGKFIARNEFAGNRYATCTQDIGLALNRLTVLWCIDIGAASNVVRTLQDNFAMQEATQLIARLKVVMVGVPRLTVAKDRFIRRETPEKGLERSRDDFRTRIRTEWGAWKDSEKLWTEPKPKTDTFHVIKSDSVDQELVDLRAILVGK